MGLGFTNGAYNRASGTRDAFGQLSDQMVREGHPRMVSRSGDREASDQVAMFVSRYRQQASGSGSFGDVRTWDGSAWGYPGGTRWVRFSPDGTVAPPGKSNHGKRRSNDLRYPYNSTSTAAHKRARVLAPRYGITCEGMNFREPWHWTFWGALGTITDNTPASTPSDTPAKTQEDTMNAEQEAKLDKALADIDWLKDRVGGKGGTTSLTDRLRGIGNGLAAFGAVVEWMRDRIGGSTKTAPSITDELRGLRDNDTPTAG